LRARAYDSGLGNFVSTSYFNISNAMHVVEVDWGNYGRLTFWVDGVQQAALTGINNSIYTMDSVRFGAPYISGTGISGSYYVDAFESRRSTYIGPLAQAPSGSPSLAMDGQFKTVAYHPPLPTQNNSLSLPDMPAVDPVFSSATFTYDGDGNRVSQTINGVTTYFVGNYYELTGAQVTKYYYAGAQRVAMRKYTIPQPMTVEYFLSDHLGSTSITTDSNGAKVSEMRYTAWGEVRYSWKSSQSTTPAYSLPDYTYTGQYSDSYINLLWYGSRHYDPELGRFISPDTIVPTSTQGVQAWDRYAYVSNNPVRYIDPSGYQACDERDGCGANNKVQSKCSAGEGYFNGSFKCTAADLNKVSIAQRKAWLNEMLASVHDELPKQFANINSILKAFDHTNTGAPGSWASWGDAGILTSIQNGLARATEQRYIPGYKRADQAWEAYTTSFITDPGSIVTNQLWGTAEGLGTTYGRLLAAENGQSKTSGEVLFLWIGDIYRNSLARYNPDAIQTDLVRSISSNFFDPAYTFGDTDITPVQLVAELLLRIGK
jgi:RHS repeat-associated protein